MSTSRSLSGATCNECSPMVLATDRRTDAIKEEAAARRAQAEVLHRQAEAILALKRAVGSGGGHVEKAIDKIAPVGELAKAVMEWQRGLCAWLKRWGRLILFFGPWVAVTVGAVTPAAGSIIKGLLNSWFGYVVH